MAKTTTVPAASFKARCLELMDRVRETRETYVITKHGKPVAKLVACEAELDDRPFVGSMKGSVLRYRPSIRPDPRRMVHGPAVETARSAAPKGRPPVDRLLVATARTLGVPLATRDGRIIRYVEASAAGRAIDISK